MSTAAPLDGGGQATPERGPLSIRERRRLNPTRAARLLLELAVLPLPAPQRIRYAREFAAELYGMPTDRQVEYCLNLLLHAPLLAWALRNPDPVEEESDAGRDWRCRLRRHRYVLRNNPQAESPAAAFFRQCVRCGRVHDGITSSSHWLSRGG